MVFPFIVVGITSGSVFALAAMGLVLTYKTSGVFNFAQGAQAAMGGFVMWELWQVHQWPWPVAALATLAIVGGVGGILLERMAFLLADKSTAAKVVATIGLLLAVEGLIVARYGSAAINMPYFLPQSQFRIDSFNVTYGQLIVVIVALLSAVGLAVFFRYQRLGIAMQGVVDNPALIGLLGTSPAAIRRTSWVVGSCFATLAGMLFAPILGLNASVLTLLVLQAFGAAAIGKFTSLPGAYLGGLAVGLGQSLLTYFIGLRIVTEHVNHSVLAPIPANFSFVLLFAVLIFISPRKLVLPGSRIMRKAKALPSWPLPTAATTGIVVLVGLIVLPHIVGANLPIYSNGLAFVVVFLSLHLLLRTSGQVSLCHMAFVGVGATTYVHASNAGLPFPLAVLAAGLVAIPVGALVAIPTIRLSGVYLAIATFGFGVLIQQIAYPTFLTFGTGGFLSAVRPGFARGGIAYYYVILSVVVLASLLVVGIHRARLGRLLNGLADSPNVLSAYGGSRNIIRVLAFCISAFLAGIAGAIIGPITGTVGSTSFSYSISLTIVAIVFFVGRRPLPAALVAAGLYVVIPSYIHSATANNIITIGFGVAAIAVACGGVDEVAKLWHSGSRLRSRDRYRSPSRSRVSIATEVAS